MVVVGVFFLIEVIQVGDFLLHLRVEIGAHRFFFLSPLVSLHLLVDELSLLHTFKEGHQLSFHILDLILVLLVELLALFWIFREELIFVAERVVEHELGEVEEVRVPVKFLLEKPQCPGEGALVQNSRLSWHRIF